MSVHGIDMYITHYVHTMSVRVYDMFVNFRFCTDMSTHIVKYTNMSATCLSYSIGQACPSRRHGIYMSVHGFAIWSGFQMGESESQCERRAYADPTRMERAAISSKLGSNYSRLFVLHPNYLQLLAII